MRSSRPLLVVRDDKLCCLLQKQEEDAPYSWRIASVNPPSSTFRSFFSGQAQDLCERSDELSEVFVGPRGAGFCDRGGIVAVFRRFVKYTVIYSSKYSFVMS